MALRIDLDTGRSCKIFPGQHLGWMLRDVLSIAGPALATGWLIVCGTFRGLTAGQILLQAGVSGVALIAVAAMSSSVCRGHAVRIVSLHIARVLRKDK